jgi:hypothetical protein
MTDSNYKSPEGLSALKSETQAQLVTKQTIKRKVVIPQVNELGLSIGSTIDILGSVKIAAKLSTTKVTKTYVDPENPEN